MWKDYFYYSKTERQGIIVLVVLILGVCTASKLFSIYFVHRNEDTNLKDKKESKKEYHDFIASLKDVNQSSRYPKRSPYSHYDNEVALAPFDPNTADSATFLSLGLPPWMIKNILRYRSKQGKFRHPEEFRKIYGLSEERYQALLPYIHIAEVFSKKDTISLLAEHKEKRDSLFKYQAGTIIDLNRADTTELKKIPGIGSGIARMIVNYRNKLSAFYQVEQLQEIHLKVENLRSWFSVDTSLIRPINLNKASIERMMSHPYLNFYQAKVIMEYRKKKGKLSSLKQLSLYDEFTPEDMKRLCLYVCFD